MTRDTETSPIDKPGFPGRQWRVLLFEIAAIFIGITASFWVEEWREERQDTETFQRILGEIYYDIILDESLITGWAATNNLALRNAGDLALRSTGLPPADVLFRQLDLVFSDFQVSPTVGGYSRLTNTALNIPVNDIQLALDNLYGVFLNGQEGVARQLAELSGIRTEHWLSRGIIPCGHPLDGVNVTPTQAERLELIGQALPAHQAIYRDDECLSEPFNHAVAVRAIENETFVVALRSAINIRQSLATLLVWQRTVAAMIRERLENYLPDISLPIETLGIIGSGTGGEWDVSEAIEMQRLGPNDWALDISLTDGEVKFLANSDWTMNWGAPRPWVATGSVMGYEEGQVSLEDAFPSGTAWFNGLNIPIRSGRYLVRFNTQSGEYSFQRLEE